MKKRSYFGTVLFSLLSYAIILIIWFLVSAQNQEFLPSPLDCLTKLGYLLQHPISKVSLGGHILASLKRVLSAVFLAVIIGIPLGLLMGWNKKVKAFIGPIFEFLRPIPPIAWIPLVILWFGVGEFSKVFLVCIGAIIPIIMNTYTGVKLVPEILLNVGKVYRANNWYMLKEIVMPASLPAIFAGIKTAVSSGWMIVLAAEMMASKSGVGFLITRGMESYDVSMIICSMLIIGVVGFAITICLTFAERRLCPWKTNIE